MPTSRGLARRLKPREDAPVVTLGYAGRYMALPPDIPSGRMESRGCARNRGRRATNPRGDRGPNGAARLGAVHKPTGSSFREADEAKPGLDQLTSGTFPPQSNFNCRPYPILHILDAFNVVVWNQRSFGPCEIYLGGLFEMLR